MSEDFDFVSAEQLLGGLPSRRASTLLFAIENRTAGLLAQVHQITEPYLRPTAAAEQESEFLAALAQGRERGRAVGIRDLERYAVHWASLLPDEAGVRAAILHGMAQKYSFTRQDVPQLCNALGADTPAVQAAFQRLYNAPLAGIYTRRATPANRLRRAWAQLSNRLEALPPFWLAFFLNTGGAAGLLALPIALAKIVSGRPCR